MPRVQRPTLPPLTAVRAFEAAARHLSFTRAASELHVTQSAVSHQVRTLEAWLGFPLFRRANREVQLTEEGLAYLPAVRGSLNKLRAATESLIHREFEDLLSISTAESFATHWLIPRLPQFLATHPHLNVRLTTQNPVDEFGNESEEFEPPWIDVVIRYGRGNWLGLQTIKLFSEEIYPVCAPSLLEGEHPLDDPRNLRHHTLLHDEMQMQWRAWLLAAGYEDVDATRGPRFSHSHMVITAALQGSGVALGRSGLVGHLVETGRLARPFGQPMPAEYSYYMLMRDAAASLRKIQLFKDWLLAQVAEATPR
jgi:LysR family glycine cleavage system transcriptional activator